MNTPSTSTKKSARHRCFMLSPNTDERGSLVANSYKSGHMFSGANLRVSLKAVKQSHRCLPQGSTLLPAFCYANPIAEFEKRNQVLPGESQHISKLSRDIHASR